MNEKIQQEVSDIMENPNNNWMIDIFLMLSIDSQYQALDAIENLIEHQNLSISNATTQVFTDIAYQMGIIR